MQIVMAAKLQEASENVQRKFTWMLPRIKDCNYKKILEKMGSFWLERRKLNGDVFSFIKLWGA